MKRLILFVAAAVASFGAVGFMQVSLQLNHAAPQGRVYVTDLAMTQDALADAQAAEKRQERIRLSALYEAARMTP